MTALKHLTQASILATQAIAREQPTAIFVNSESSEFFQPCCPDKKTGEIAAFENERRFISLDLIYGVRPSPRIRSYLLEHGMTTGEFGTFTRRIAGDDTEDHGCDE